MAQHPGYSLAQFNKLVQKTDRLKAATARVREKAGETVETVVRAAEVSGAAFLLGFTNMRFSKEEGGRLVPPEMFGVPVDLLVGAGAHVLAFAGIGGKAEEHMRAVGDGALAVYFASLGRGVGLKVKQDGLKSLVSKEGSKVARLAGDAGKPLTPEEIARVESSVIDV